jgi:hypothetical protein
MTYTPPTFPYRNLAEIKRANRASNAPHWFEPETLRFHGSYVAPTVYGGRWFVTRESTDWDHADSAWTVRRANDDGTIATEGEYLAHATRADAEAAAQALAAAAESTAS